MDDNYLNYFLIFLILIYCIQRDTKKKKRKVKKKYNIKTNESISYIEITKLIIQTKKQLVLFFNYNKTFNHVINDGKRVYINTLKPLKNKLIYNDIIYNLTSIEFNIGTTLFNGNTVPLELHLINKSNINGNIIRVIGPLLFIDTNPDGNTLNIIETSDIPFYTCCSPNIGKLKSINLHPINNILNKNNIYYKSNISTKSNISFYISPIQFNRMVGKKIIKSLQK